MSAPDTCGSRRDLLLDVPDFLQRTGPAAIYGWMSSRTLLIIKDGENISLCADDIVALIGFISANGIGEQL